MVFPWLKISVRCYVRSRMTVTSTFGEVTSQILNILQLFRLCPIVGKTTAL